MSDTPTVLLGTITVPVTEAGIEVLRGWAGERKMVELSVFLDEQVGPALVAMKEYVSKGQLNEANQVVGYIRCLEDLSNFLNGGLAKELDDLPESE